MRKTILSIMMPVLLAISCTVTPVTTAYATDGTVDVSSEIPTTPVVIVYEKMSRTEWLAVDSETYDRAKTEAAEYVDSLDQSAYTDQELTELSVKRCEELWATYKKERKADYVQEFLKELNIDVTDVTLDDTYPLIYAELTNEQISLCETIDKIQSVTAQSEWTSAEEMGVETFKFVDDDGIYTEKLQEVLNTEVEEVEVKAYYSIDFNGADVATWANDEAEKYYADVDKTQYSEAELNWLVKEKSIELYSETRESALQEARNEIISFLGVPEDKISFNSTLLTATLTTEQIAQFAESGKVKRIGVPADFPTAEDLGYTRYSNTTTTDAETVPMVLVFDKPSFAEYTQIKNDAYSQAKEMALAYAETLNVNIYSEDEILSMSNEYCQAQMDNIVAENVTEVGRTILKEISADPEQAVFDETYPIVYCDLTETQVQSAYDVNGFVYITTRDTWAGAAEDVKAYDYNPSEERISEKLQSAMEIPTSDFDVYIWYNTGVNGAQIKEQADEEAKAYYSEQDTSSYTDSELHWLIIEKSLERYSAIQEEVLSNTRQELCDLIGMKKDMAEFSGNRMHANLISEQILALAESEMVTGQIMLVEEFLTAEDLGYKVVPAETTEPLTETTSTSETTAPDSATNIDFEAESIQVKDGDWIDHEPVIYTNSESLPDGDEFAKYDDTFFSEHSLIYLHLGETSGSIKETVKQIIVDEDGVWHIVVDSYISDKMTADVAAWEHFITVPNILTAEMEIVVDRTKTYEKAPVTGTSATVTTTEKTEPTQTTTTTTTQAVKIVDKISDSSSKLSDGVKQACEGEWYTLRVYLILKQNAIQETDEAQKRADAELATLNRDEYDDIMWSKLTEESVSKYLNEVVEENRNAVLNEIGIDLATVKLTPWLSCDVNAEQLQAAQDNEKVIGIYLCDDKHTPYLIDECKTYKDVTAEELAEWAVKDYQSKNSVTPANSAIVLNENDMFEVTLTDENGEVLDVYTIDPETAEGTNQTNEEVNLPQTGITSVRNWIIFIGGFVLIAFGSFAMFGSGIIKRKDEN